MRPQAASPSWREALVVSLACLACLAVFFRAQIGNGFTLLLGDRHDAVIALAIMEHWRNWLQGAAAWNATAYFFPVPGTLGYNDGYLLFGLPLAGFRALGADPFLAGELTNMALRGLGFLGTHLLARRLLGLRLGFALLLAAVLTLANNLAIRGSHAQLFSVSLVPGLAVLAHAALAALWDGRRGALLGWGAAFLAGFAAVLMTGFYMAWYCVYLSLPLLLAWLALAGAARRRALWQALRSQWAPIAALLALAGLLNLPFLLVYLPKAAETGMHDYAMVSRALLSPLDLLHVGERNYLWGWLVRGLNAGFRPGFPFWSEQMTGLTPGLLLVFLTAIAWLFRRGALVDPTALWRALAVAVLLTWAATVQVGGHSAWWLVYSYFPGAKAARVVARYQLFLMLPVAAIAVLFLARTAPRWPRPALLALCALLLAEQLNGYAPLFLNRPLEAARLAAIPAPPAACRSFFVTAARTTRVFDEEIDTTYNHNTEAMLVAEVLRLPTINGISTFNPPGWPDGLAESTEYRAAVRAWAARWQLQGLCGLDLQRFTWDADPLR